jgi:hypothetical protein
MQPKKLRYGTSSTEINIENNKFDRKQQIAKVTLKSQANPEFCPFAAILNIPDIDHKYSA